MKKSFLLFLLLICLAVGGLAGMSVWVSKDNEAVEVTQTTLQGDPAAAQGLTITVHNQMFNQLFWDTKFPAANAAESISEFRFSQKVLNFYEFHDYPPEISMPSFGGGMSSDMGIDLEREDWGNGGILTRPAIDLAKTMGPNETKSKTVHVADYYSCYPIVLDYYTRYYGDEDLEDQWRNGQEAFQRFFSIPIPSQVQVTYTITTNEMGEVIELYCDTQSWLELNTAVAQGDGGYYYILDSHVSEDEAKNGMVQMDLSHIQGGYGVYFVPFLENEASGWADLKMDQVQTVYQVPQGERTVNLFTNEKGNLLLYTVAGETWYLNVLSSDGRQLLQRLELGQMGSNGYMVDPLEGEDHMLLFFNDHQLILLTWDGEDYALAHALQMPEDEQWDDSGKEQLAHWDGQRLALLERNSLSWEDTSYRLTVWQGGELTYQGVYTRSFAKNNATQRYSNAIIRGIDSQAIELSG